MWFRCVVENKVLCNSLLLCLQVIIPLTIFLCCWCYNLFMYICVGLLVWMSVTFNELQMASAFFQWAAFCWSFTLKNRLFFFFNGHSGTNLWNLSVSFPLVIVQYNFSHHHSLLASICFMWEIENISHMHMLFSSLFSLWMIIREFPVMRSIWS